MTSMSKLVVVIAAVLVLDAGQAGTGQNDTQALPRLVATERAFAAATGEVGVRDGFLAFFAPDSVQIRRGAEPLLAPARPGLMAQPLAPLPIANRLIWEPFTGQVSSDGRLGWLTGGFVFMNEALRTVVAQGAFFSVWMLQPDGTWRVWLDEGIRTPQIWRDAAPFRVAPDPDAGAPGDKPNATTPDESIVAVEKTLAQGGDAWRERLATGVRLHVEGAMPFVGRDAVAASPRATAPTRYAVVQAVAATSGDLAVTIGAFETPDTPPARRGSWVRVWKRDVVGRWQIVFQTENGG